MDNINLSWQEIYKNGLSTGNFIAEINLRRYQETLELTLNV